MTRRRGGRAALVTTLGTLLMGFACGAPPPATPEATTLTLGNATVTGSPGVVVPSQGAPRAELSSPVPVSPQDPSWGSPLAPVTMVVFSDFQCPFCRRLNAEIEALKGTYGPGRLRLVWKHEPLSFHPFARPAAEAAAGVYELAGADAFWKFHTLAFNQQADLNRQHFLIWARAAGVADMGAFEAGLDAHRWAAKVDADHDLAARLHVDGTPVSYVNGVLIAGAVPAEAFRKVIDGALLDAEARAKAGVSPERLYAEASTANYKPKAAREDDEEAEAPDTKIYRVPVGAAPVLGPATALVTIVTYSDFQCPYCKRIEPTFAQLRQTYGNKIRFVWKNEPLPFHPRAVPAANLAYLARATQGDAGFWRAHDALFASQPKLEDTDLMAIGAQLHLDPTGLQVAIRQNRFASTLRADAAEAEDVQATGTPHSFVNGRRLVGAQPYSKFAEVVDAEMRRAEAALAAGASPMNLYDTLTKDGVAPAGPQVATNPPPPVPAHAYARGDAHAKVTIQVFSDYQCPFCARVEPTLTKLLADYPGKVRIVWRDHPLPMHSNAALAAEAAREAGAQRGNAGYWAMHDKLFANNSSLERADLEKYASELQLDLGRFRSALDGHVHTAAVAADAAAAASVGADGTPAAYVGNYFISGAQPYERFARLVDRTLDPSAPRPTVIAPAPTKP